VTIALLRKSQADLERQYSRRRKKITRETSVPVRDITVPIAGMDGQDSEVSVFRWQHFDCKLVISSFLDFLYCKVTLLNLLAFGVLLIRSSWIALWAFAIHALSIRKACYQLIKFMKTTSVKVAIWHMTVDKNGFICQDKLGTKLRCFWRGTAMRKNNSVSITGRCCLFDVLISWKSYPTACCIFG